MTVSPLRTDWGVELAEVELPGFDLPRTVPEIPTGRTHARSSPRGLRHRPRPGRGGRLR
ncbi:hypothetical protein ACRAWF_22935 [Streptomyces sp. L7]